MPCDDWCRLLECYCSAVNRYDEAVKHLTRVSGVAFNSAWQQAEQARKHSGDCRAELLHHEHDHACSIGIGQAMVNSQTAVNTEELVLGDQGQSGG